MKHLKHIAFSLCFVLFILGCKQSNWVDAPEDIFNIDLTKKYDDIPFKLSDLSDDIKFVRLETNKNSLLSNFRGFVGDKYIISIGYKKVLQFSADGKYICTIAIKGRGPMEFHQIDAWAVDDNEHFLFYHDYSKNYINKYNLDSFKFERKIPFEENGDLSSMLSINDSTLAILPNMFAKYGYLYFYQSHTGRILEGIKKEPVPHPGAWAGRTPIFVKTANNSILFQPSETDTVYRIEGSEIEPVISLMVEKPQKSGDKTTGFNISFQHMDNNRIFLCKSGYESIVTPNSSSIKSLDVENLVFYKNNNTIHRISRIYNDYLGIQLNTPYIYFPQHNRFIVQYQALDFKKLLEDAIKEGILPENKINSFKKLNSEISESDNPILITGKCRQ